MNVFDASAGREEKACAACCAATKAEMVFTCRSFVNAGRARERGSEGGLGVAAAAVAGVSWEFCYEK